MAFRFFPGNNERQMTDCLCLSYKQPWGESNLAIQQQMNGQTKRSLYVQWSTQP